MPTQDKSVSTIDNSVQLKLSLLQDGLTQQLDDLNVALLDSAEEFMSDFKRITEANKRLKYLIDQLPSLEPDYDTELADFWSHIRHELKTPINAIKNYAEMIAEDLSDNSSDPDMAKSLKSVSESAEALVPLINLIGSEHQSTEIIGADEDEEEWHEEGTVLIIDDNLDNCDVLSRRLDKVGLKVLVANDGYEGLKLVRNNPIDLVLLDIMMPGLNGYEVLERMKHDHDFMHIPILMISSVSELSSIVKCIKIGADDYLPTPFNPTLLKARISACLQKKRNIDRDHKLMKEIKVARAQLETAIHSIEEGFALFNAEDELVMHNPPFESMYPWLFHLGPNNPTYQDFLREGLANGTFMLDRRVQEKPEDWYNLKIKQHKNPSAPQIQRLSSGVWMEIHEYKTPDGGIVSVHKDITERKKDEDHLMYMAHHDPLTGLANRNEFEMQLQRAIHDARKEHQAIALLFIDLDGFKKVNDTLGHEFGDFLLIKVSDRLKESIRDNDIVARIGGDEFCIIIKNYDSKEILQKIAERTLSAVGTSIAHNGQIAEFGLSIGIATYPDDSKTSDDLVKAADSAMYAAKKDGKGTYRFYGEKAKKKKA